MFNYVLVHIQTQGNAQAMAVIEKGVKTTTRCNELFDEFQSNLIEVGINAESFDEFFEKIKDALKEFKEAALSEDLIKEGAKFAVCEMEDCDSEDCPAYDDCKGTVKHQELLKDKKGPYAKKCEECKKLNKTCPGKRSENSLDDLIDKLITLRKMQSSLILTRALFEIISEIPKEELDEITKKTKVFMEFLNSVDKEEEEELSEEDSAKFEELLTDVIKAIRLSLEKLNENEEADEE